MDVIGLGSGFDGGARAACGVVFAAPLMGSVGVGAGGGVLDFRAVPSV